MAEDEIQAEPGTSSSSDDEYDDRSAAESVKDLSLRVYVKRVSEQSFDFPLDRSLDKSFHATGSTSSFS